MLEPLDFMIIGAQKSATTALHTYLSEHPRIAMPLAKEAPFFDRGEYGAAAWRAFSKEHFQNCGEQLRGKASPQYMADYRVPGRIAALMPQTRLIAILRDPVERAYSHYQMTRRRETEYRSFEAAMDTALNYKFASRARTALPPLHEQEYESEEEFYLAWGEYGRILTGYLEHFSREQILVLTTSELKEAPGATLDKIYRFLELPVGFRPESLGRVVHQGGSQPRLSRAWKERLKAFAPLRWAWQAVPESRRAVWRFWLDQKNVRKGSAAPMVLSAATRLRLSLYFAPDIALLQQSFGLCLPWAAAYDVGKPVANCDSRSVANCEISPFMMRKKLSRADPNPLI